MNELTVDKSHVVVDSLSYRGLQFDFYEDPEGRQYYTYYNGKKLEFGVNNLSYKDDFKKYLDNALDTITRFPQFQKLSGVRLTWFNNGGFRDIKLVHWNRVIKIWLVADPKQVNETSLISESEKIIKTLVKKNKLKSFKNLFTIDEKHDII